MKQEEQDQRSFQKLPLIPDYPNTPLPAWKHYGITNYAGQMLVDKLDSIQYPGYMIGLELTCLLEDESSYSMKFGMVEIPAEESKEQDEPNELPIDDDFLLQLYQDVKTLMVENAPDYQGTLEPMLTYVMTGSKIKVQIMCRRPEVCTLNHTDKRVCKKVGTGPWTCLDKHFKCK